MWCLILIPLVIVCKFIYRLMELLIRTLSSLLFCSLPVLLPCLYAFFYFDFPVKLSISENSFWKHHYRLDQQTGFHPLSVMTLSVYWSIDLKSAGLVIVSIVSIYRKGICWASFPFGKEGGGYGHLYITRSMVFMKHDECKTKR